MSCCGSKRTALHSRRRNFAAPPSESATLYRKRRSANSAVPLRYVGSTELSLIGTVTGTVYSVTETSVEIAVDERDVGALLRTRLFERP
jgi:hypothetical protein